MISKLLLVRIFAFILLTFSIAQLGKHRDSESTTEVDFELAHLSHSKKTEEFRRRRHQFDSLPFASAKKTAGKKFEKDLQTYLNSNPFDYVEWLTLVEVQKYLTRDDQEREWVLANAFATGRWNKRFNSLALTYCFEEPFFTFEVCDNESAKLNDTHMWKEELRRRRGDNSSGDE